MRFSRDDRALGQVLTFLVAGVIFLAAIGTVLLVSRNSGRQDRGAPEAGQNRQAQRLADLLVNSPGIGWSTPDSIARLGLRAINGSGLQDSSLEALRGALFTSTNNGKVDYPEARASLGLTGTQDFHISMYPVGMSSVYKAADSKQRTGYIGDWQSLLAFTIPNTTPTGDVVSAEAQINTTMFAQTASERLALRDLGLNFNDRVFISSLAPTILVTYPFPQPSQSLLTAANVQLIAGDVYPDVKSYLDANLPGRLVNYDLLIVGSGVDQSSLTSAAVKYAIRDWVLAGGTLVVLGSNDLNYQWVQPLFDTGVRTANGAASAPDPSHPLLQEPHVLDWTHYNDHNMAWAIKTQSAEGFSDVIVQNGDDVMAVSNDGAFGLGRIILTTYLPREIAGSIGQLEAENFLENVVLFTDHTKLYLQYGPQQPSGQAVAVAVRESYVFDPTLGQIPVRLEIHFWGS